MAKVFRCIAVVTALAIAAVCLFACASSSQESSDTSASGKSEHIIGVAVYNVSDSEVLMFRQYLVEYVSKVCFEDVRFVYSESITSEDEMLAFIDEVADMGGEGLMSFYNIDLKSEVERCASHGMYHIVASGSVSDEDFAKVENNEYFLGVVGPLGQVEYAAGADMARFFAGEDTNGAYFILTGGASLGNEMHYQRALGMLNALAESYALDLGDTAELAAATEVKTVQQGDLTITVAPGYLSNSDSMPKAEKAFNAGKYDVVLSTLPIAPVADALLSSDVRIGQVDCYSQDNQLLFNTGKLDYLAGKYGSLVGPSFVMMYDAVTGHAQDIRDGGKAFKIKQSFWESSSAEDFNAKYELASNITSPAYNYEDLYSICCKYEPNVTFADVRDLAEKCSYEDGLERRSER